MTREEFFNQNNWEKSVFKKTIHSRTKGFLEKEASEVHQFIDEINKFTINEYYWLRTTIVQKDKESFFLKIKITRYADKCERKKNSHNQRKHI